MVSGSVGVATVSSSTSHVLSGLPPQFVHAELVAGSTKWKQVSRQNRFSRCVGSAGTTLIVSTMTIVALSIGAIWYPSAVMSGDELLAASERHHLTTAQQVSKEVLSLLQIASSRAKQFSLMYTLAQMAAPEEGPMRYIEEFGVATWAILKQEPTLASLLVAQARKPALVNPDDPSCDVDGILLSATYKSIFTVGNSGTGFNSTPVSPSDAARAGHARLNNVQGAFELTDPVAYNSTRAERRCEDWLGGGESLWRIQRLPGSWQLRDSGVQGVSWDPGVLVVGSYPSQSLYKKVFFDIPGPSWASSSSFGALSVRISSSATSDALGANAISEILEKVAAQDGQIGRRTSWLFVLSGEGELVASSLPEQQIELRDGEGSAQPGKILGLVRADDAERVQPPLRDVAARLIKQHCSTAAHGGFHCEWGGIQDLQHIGSHVVAASVVDDPLASGLGMVLLNIADLDAVQAQASHLDENMWAISGSILVAALVIAVLLSRATLVPLRTSRDNMFMLGDMKVEEAIQQNHASRTLCCSLPLTEVRDLRHSFIHAATCLKDWRDKEMDRRVHLEAEESTRKRTVVERAVNGSSKLSQPMALVGACHFLQLDRLTPYETLRDTGNLVFLDTEDALAEFQASSYIVFLSHEWLSWGFPDDARNTHLIAMQNSVRNIIKTVSQDVDEEAGRDIDLIRDIFIWVDYCCIAQQHRGMQMIAVPSLPKYVLSADAFIIVAPVADHESGRRCSLQSYGSRGWCRTEVMAKLCSSGIKNLFTMCSEDGELEQVGEKWLTSFSVNIFEGEFSCCQRGHMGGSSCDKEALVEPILSMYSLMLRQVRCTRSEAVESMLKHVKSKKERFFPRTFTFVGMEKDEQRELFGSLAEETEKFVLEIPWMECQKSVVTPLLTPREVSPNLTERLRTRRLTASSGSVEAVRTQQKKNTGSSTSSV